MCGGSMGGSYGSSMGGMTKPFGMPEKSSPYSVNMQPQAPTPYGGAGGKGYVPPGPEMGPLPGGVPSWWSPPGQQPQKANEMGGGIAAPASQQAPQPFLPRRGPMDYMQAFGQFGGQMPNANPNAAFNRPEMSKPFSMGGQLDALNSAAMAPQQAPQPMDPRLAYQQNQQRMAQPQAPLNGAYDYSPLSAQQSEMNQQKAGTYPGATPPPGYVAPPPGPFADWMNPIMASMAGLAGSAPSGMNAFNNRTGQWGNIDWFPGYPRG